MKAFDIGLSALRAQQLTLSVLGNNLANASTPGYHRQQVDLATRSPLREDTFSIGTGVDVTNIRRLTNDAVETALIRNSSEAGFSQQTRDIAAQIDLHVAMAAYGDYGPGYIGTEVAYGEGGYETSPQASSVAPEVEKVLINAVQQLLEAGQNSRVSPTAGTEK